MGIFHLLLHFTDKEMRAQSVKESVQGHTEQASFKTGYGHNGRSRWRLWSVLPFSVLASSHRSWLQTAIWPLTSGPPPLSMSNQLLGWADGSAPAWQAYCSPTSNLSQQR